jgi:hypothetical protein
MSSHAQPLNDIIRRDGMNMPSSRCLVATLLALLSIGLADEGKDESRKDKEREYSGAIKGDRSIFITMLVSCMLGK